MFSLNHDTGVFHNSPSDVCFEVGMKRLDHFSTPDYTIAVYSLCSTKRMFFTDDAIVAGIKKIVMDWSVAL